MTRRKFDFAWFLVAMFAGLGGGGGVAFADPAPGPAPRPEYALGFLRGARAAGEFHRSVGSKIALKRQGTGVGFGMLFPLTDSNFDVGVRYVYIHEARDPDFSGGPSAFTLLTFVFDYFVWPTKVGGLFVGGEIGVTDPATNEFFSVYTNYAFVGKVGYEYTIPSTRWSATFEARRSVLNKEPLKATSQSELYSNDIAFGARYRL